MWKRCEVVMAKETKKLICIRCPRGCEVVTTIDGYSVDTVQGNVCKMGLQYVKDEVESPKRILTTLVKVKNGVRALVPVWTEEPIPKEKFWDLVKELRSVEIEAPVKVGQVVLKDVFGTGVDVVTSGAVRGEG
jgi:CxxC motif-containing protein